MAITSTTVISAVSLTSPGGIANATKLTLQAASTKFVVEGRLTTVAAISRSSLLRVWYAVSSYSVTAAAGVVSHARHAKPLDLVALINGGVAVTLTSALDNCGGILYVWTETSALVPAPTLSVVVSEW